MKLTLNTSLDSQTAKLVAEWVSQSGDCKIAITDPLAEATLTLEVEGVAITEPATIFRTLATAAPAVNAAQAAGIEGECTESPSFVYEYKCVCLCPL